MGHSVSDRKRLSCIMASSLADFAGWRLGIRCLRYRETTEIRI